MRARDGYVIALSTEGDPEIGKMAQAVLELPDMPELVQAIVAVVPLQLFAYYVADLRGTDIDQPRNLAKTVTVE